MVDETELFRIADELAAEGEIPSQRLVRRRLGGRGSYRDIGPLLLDWRLKTKFRPLPVKEDVPPNLLEKLAAVAAEIWADGRLAGLIIGRNERVRLTEERDHWKDAHAEAADLAEALELRMTTLDARDANVGVTRDRKEASEFWTAVMREIARLLGDQSLSVSDIIKRLSKETRDQAPELRGRGGEAFLAYKMRHRGGRTRQFEEIEENVFRNRREDDATGQLGQAAVAGASVAGSGSARRPEDSKGRGAEAAPADAKDVGKSRDRARAKKTPLVER